MNKLTPAKRGQILHMLVEGSSVRGTARMAQVSVNTVMKLLIEAGAVCEAYMDIHLTNLAIKRVQIDEIWSFVKAKRHNLPLELRDLEGFGDVWTYTAICPDTKLVPCWRVGSRDMYNTQKFIRNLASRIPGIVQLTSDGNTSYLNTVQEHFKRRVDFGMLVKYYGDGVIPNKNTVKDKFVEAKSTIVSGMPDPQHITTSHVERFNLTMRTSIKRFARKTNAHSKKMANHNHAIAIHVFFYNFVRIHQTIRVTPAMAAGITPRLWSMDDMVSLIDGYYAIKVITNDRSRRPNYLKAFV